MGNQSSKKKKYDTKEIGILDQMFHEMAVRSPDDTIAKDTFLKFFDLPGVLGDRLFEVFDTKKTGVIDFEEFMDGFARFSRGDPSAKMDMLFQLFDLDGKGGITRDELTTVLMSIIIPPNQVMHNNARSSRRVSAASAVLNSSPVIKGSDTPKLSPAKSMATKSPRLDAPSPALNFVQSNNSYFQLDNGGANSFIQEAEAQPLDIDEVQQRVNAIVKQAFDECDVDNSQRLDAQEFRAWLKNKPEIIELCEELFVQLAWNGPDTAMRSNFNMEKAEIRSKRYEGLSNAVSLRADSADYSECSGECKLRFVTSREKIPPPYTSDNKTDDDDNNNNALAFDYVILAHATGVALEFAFCPKCGSKLSHSCEDGALPTLDGGAASRKSNGASSNVPGVIHEGSIKMAVGKFNQLKRRYIVLHGKFLYVYKNKQKPFPETVVFIQGYFAEISKSQKFSNFQYIMLNPPNGSSGRAVHLYTVSLEDANKWLEALEVAAQTVSIRKYYELGETLGTGSFASVRIAKEKATGRRVAVKIIEKKVIDGKQKEYIRIEMSVMKLVRHPNVMRLEQVFETKSEIYMVMPLYAGGDLYEYMKNHARHGLKEDESRRIIYNVLSALKYLHSVGIVHRDLKPENLLLIREKDPTEIVITDFGLSKFAAPHEAMKATCGTLSYVAPEVLRMEGYGKEVDLWSTGVIMFLTLRAKLPFHDTTKNRIIARILRQNVQLVDPHWQKISKEAKDLIQKLLIKNQAQRITCDNAMKHHWFEPIKEPLNNAPNEIVTVGKELYASKDGTESVRDIKVYNNDDTGALDDEDEDADEEEDDDDGVQDAPMQVIRQSSIQERNQY